METFLFGPDLGTELKNLVLVILLETREDTKINKVIDLVNKPKMV